MSAKSSWTLWKGSMIYDQLEHAIRAACNVSGDTDLYIFGSQAILGQHPDAPPELRTSIEVDVQPQNKPETTDKIDGALGELSQFHKTHGFYVHGVLIEAATLPTGWGDRTIPVSHPIGTRGNMLMEGLVDPDILRDRIATLTVDEERWTRLREWVAVTVEDL